MNARPTPSAHGDFARTPLSHVLMSIHERGLTGTLSIQAPENDPSDLSGESLVFFSEGLLAQVSLARQVDTLGALLHEAGIITRAQLDESLLGLARKEGLQGEILIKRGACTLEQMEAMLVTQIRRKIARLFLIDNARYEFFADTDLLRKYGGERLLQTIHASLWRGLRGRLDHPAVRKLWERIAAHALRVKVTPDDIELFEFDAEEQLLLKQLSQNEFALEQWTRSLSPTSAATARCLASTLLVSRKAEVIAPKPVPAPPREAAPAPPKPVAVPTPPPRAIAQPVTAPRVAAPPVVLTAEQKQRIAAAQEQWDRMQEQTLFEMLGIASNANDAAVQSAFLSVVGRWHPDRINAQETELRELHTKIFALFNEAQSTLGDQELRMRYVASMKDGGGTPNARKRVSALLDAANDVQKAEVALKRRAIEEAETLVRRALSVLNDDAHALLVLSSVLLETRREGSIDEAVTTLRKAAKLAPDADKIHFALGQALQRKGDVEAATAAFRKAVQLNPRNTDAAREVQIAKIRARSGPAPTENKDGLISKFLKR